MPVVFIDEDLMRFEDIDWDNWAPAEEATLTYVLRGSQVLLIHKKRGLGAGKVNAPGGRVRQGENPRQAALRECREELGVVPLGVSKSGEVLFQTVSGTAVRIHVFHAVGFTGEPRETEEAVPEWVPVDRIPYDQMWEGDRHWLPLALEGGAFEARTLFDGDSLLGHSITAAPASRVLDSGAPDADTEADTRSRG